MPETLAPRTVYTSRHNHSHTGSHLIGICGGSGSGKTLVARSVESALGAQNVLLMEQDSYYRDLAHLSFEDRHKVNFDHPSAFDNDLLIDHLHDLLAGHAVRMPEYDYAHHTRSTQYRDILPRVVILLDGILVFEDHRLRDLMDIRVYIDTDADIRLARRIRRDISNAAAPSKPCSSSMKRRCGRCTSSSSSRSSALPISSFPRAA